MSTRSGKRLHNASNGNIEPELALKCDRKTRSKRVLDDSESQAGKTKKKRQNYVSYPSEEDTADVNSLEDGVQVKPVHALRRQTLKEHNADTEEVDTAIITKKQVRSTRRTRKFSEIADDVPVVPLNEEPVEVSTVTNTKTKVKKNKQSKKEQPEVNDKENEVKAGKKKKNKKKKSSQSNSLVEQEELKAKKKNDSNMSTNSIHSAAGSPLHKHVTPRLNNSISKQPGDIETLLIQKPSAKRWSSLKRVSEQNTSIKTMEVEVVDATNIPKILIVRATKRRRSKLKIVPDKDTLPDAAEKMDLNATFEKEPAQEGSSKKKRKSNVMRDNNDPVVINKSNNLNIPKTSVLLVLNTTFEKDDMETDVSPFEKNKKSDNKKLTNGEQTNNILNLSYEIRRSPRKSVSGSEKDTVLIGTFELSPKPELSKQKSLDSTYDKENKLDSTFDKITQNPSLRSSLISSDDATNSSIVTLDKSDDNSKINITDDDSKTENILNTTPVLIESSMEGSRVSVLESSLKENKTPETKPTSTTPLKREGTFTKDSPCMSPKTPNKRQTLAAAGCTPYHSDRKVSQTKRTLNQTHSIEKPRRRSSLAEMPPRATRVMFCSPVNDLGVAMQRKSKIIKSNLKGSDKSFVFEEGDSVLSSVPTRMGRKRSFTHTDAEQVSTKRTRLNTERSLSAARARTSSAMAKLSNAVKPNGVGTPSKPATPKSEVKATKLPNFAALHARRFQRMESLDECQQRKAKRAKQLLVPTGSVAVLERSSPRVTLEPKPRDTPTKPAAPAAPAPASTKPKPPTLDTLQLRLGYTRFGFKMNCDVNPFTLPKTDKPKETPNIKPNAPKVIKPVTRRELPQPSLAGATSLRRAVAKQTIMREKSLTLTEKRSETRKEVRTVIKGVRTNRRFELQMKSRNLNG